MGTGTWEVAPAASPPHQSMFGGDAAAPHGCLKEAGPRAAVLAVSCRCDRFGLIRAFRSKDLVPLTDLAEGTCRSEANPCLASVRDRGVDRDGS